LQSDCVNKNHPFLGDGYLFGGATWAISRDPLDDPMLSEEVAVPSILLIYLWVNIPIHHMNIYIYKLYIDSIDASHCQDCGCFYHHIFSLQVECSLPSDQERPLSSRTGPASSGWNGGWLEGAIQTTNPSPWDETSNWPKCELENPSINEEFSIATCGVDPVLNRFCGGVVTSEPEQATKRVSPTESFMGTQPTAVWTYGFINDQPRTRVKLWSIRGSPK